MSNKDESTFEGYESVRQGAKEGMGGGQGVQGSGVAGGHEGSQKQAPASGSTGQKQDWLDKGITSVGKKFGFNLVSSNVPAGC